MTKIIFVTIMNLVTPEDGAEHDLLFNELASAVSIAAATLVASEAALAVLAALAVVVALAVVATVVGMAAAVLAILAA